MWWFIIAFCRPQRRPQKYFICIPVKTCKGLLNHIYFQKQGGKRSGIQWWRHCQPYVFVYFHASILGHLMFKYRGSVYFEISYSCYWRRLHHRILINELLILVHDIIYLSSAVSSETFLACYCVLLCILLQPAQWPLWKLWITSCNNFVRHRCKFNKGPHAHLWFLIFFLSCLPCPRLRKQLVRTAFWTERRTEIRQVETTLEQSRNLKGGRLKLMPSFVRCYSSWM